MEEERGFTFEQLLKVLWKSGAQEAERLGSTHRTVHHGLLPVGIKLHLLRELTGFTDLIMALGDEHHGGGPRPYRHAQATRCIVLPPVGSAEAAIRLLSCIGRATQESVFNSEHVRIQVCSAGRLEPRSAALLSVCFYLGSDVLRKYNLPELETTFSDNSQYPQHKRGRRLTIYDASGPLDRGFEFWDFVGSDRALCTELPFKTERTDVLVARTRVDIRNINLVATLLLHLEKLAWWEHLGRQFVAETEKVLREHLLDGILEAPWLRTGDETTFDDLAFFAALQEISGYAEEEHRRLNKRTPLDCERPSILQQVHGLLQVYRTALVREARSFETGEQP